MSNVRQVWFMPWLSIDREFTLGPCRFIPGEHVLGMATLGEQSSLSTIFGTYRALSGEPVPTPAVLASVADPLASLDREQRAHNFEIATMLAFSEIAENDYFNPHGSVVNSSHFALIGQNFTPGRDFGPALSWRRRTGAIRDGGYRYADLHNRCPIEAQPHVLAITESALRQAITTSWATPLGRLIRSAAFWFIRANTDSWAWPEEAEVKMMGTVFEVLAEVDSYQKNEPIRQFVMTKLSFDAITRPAWQAITGWKKLPTIQDTWTTFEFWWNDFYLLRNVIEHEGTAARQVLLGVPSWGAWKHLLFATIVLPMIVRRLLEEEGYYALSEVDRRRRELIEALLLQHEFFAGGPQGLDDAMRAAETRRLGR